MEKENVKENNENIESYEDETNTQEMQEKNEEIINELKDKLLRTAAENENLRKRFEKQIEDTAKFAVTNFAKDLINVADNLMRALNSIDSKSLENDKFLQSIYSGVEITKKELFGVFEKNKIKLVMPEIGEPFDHNIHQAVAHVENSELPAGSIAEVLQNGYTIYDRLLRPAMVSVVKAS